MPYNVTWYTENQIMLYEYDGVITLEDVRDSNCDAYELMRRATQKIDYLVDLRHIQKITFSMGEMLTVDSLIAMITHPLNHWTAYYDKRSAFAQLLMQITHQSVQGRARFFDSQDEALAFFASLERED